MNLNKKLTWNIAGAFSRYRAILKYFEKKDIFDRYKKINVYDGIEMCSWNGGRLNQDIKYDESLRDLYYSLGWSISLTFTNNTIDLSDKTGNFLLEKMHHEGNSVILINNDLKEYIQNNFPKYRIIYSTVGCSFATYPMDNKTYKMYSKIASSYDSFVPRSDNNFDDLLRLLPKDKIEILVSDTCILNCPLREKHYNRYAKLNKSIPSKEDSSSYIGDCLIDKDTFTKRTNLMCKALKDRYPFFLHPYQIKKLILEGFYNFKIHGRDSDDTLMFKFLERYLVDYSQDISENDYKWEWD